MYTSLCITIKGKATVYTRVHMYFHHQGYIYVLEGAKLIILETWGEAPLAEVGDDW